MTETELKAPHCADRTNKHPYQDYLIDTIVDKMKLKNDAALCRKLGVTPPVISKIRSGAIPLGATMLVNLHEESGLSIAELKALAGMPPAVKVPAEC